jgi:hypothetical protein
MMVSILAIAISASNPAGAAAPRPVTIPIRFHGEFDAAQKYCGTGVSDMRLRISANKIRFYESEGTRISILTQPNGEITVLAEYHGEGESWHSMGQFALSPDGKRLIVRNPAGDQIAQQSTTRIRCTKKK